MQIREVLAEAKNKMGERKDFIAVEVLLAFSLNQRKEYLITHDLETITSEPMEIFWSLFERFLKGEPVAYLTTQKEFFGLEFFVDKRVLIPRPETEMIVEAVLARKSQFTNPKIVDVGTGSGCIAVTVAKNLPEAKITALDISAEALEVALMNAKKHQVENQVSFLESNLLEKLEGDFDIMVANLPYIGSEHFNFVSKDVDFYEPHLALYSGEDGLKLYRKLFEQVACLAHIPSLFVGEFGFLQHPEIERLFHEFFDQQQSSLEIFADYANIERIFVISHKEIS